MRRHLPLAVAFFVAAATSNAAAQVTTPDGRVIKGVGPDRTVTNENVPMPGSGQVVPAPASAAGSAAWEGCRAYVDRFKNPMQMCCTINAASERSCEYRYSAQ
ncbi:MAG: hypothetical protein J0I29_10310 [Rhizobiales bacterium]|nr:hypothetical protein [Hyphomicrobiales bacterium]